MRVFLGEMRYLAVAAAAHVCACHDRRRFPYQRLPSSHLRRPTAGSGSLLYFGRWEELRRQGSSSALPSV
jgi:hypothetical protein